VGDKPPKLFCVLCDKMLVTDIQNHEGDRTDVSSKVDNSLAVKNPALAKQWHLTRNGELTPENVTPNSGKKVWWMCDKGHEWESTIYNRVKGNGCPYCSGRLADAETSLQAQNPELAKQWHPTKNKILTPNDVTASSGKKVWWMCINRHEWEAKVSNRSNGRNCPYCSGKRADIDNCLHKLNPKLAMQWHPNKNGNLTPFDVTIGSNKRVWWMCEKRHEWEASINSRSSGIGCPFCAGKRACADNCLHVINPYVSKQWHPTKNGKLLPYDVTAGSGKSVWWMCEKGHEWKAIINSRSSGNGCPECNRESQTSFPEQAIYHYLKRTFSDAVSRYKYKSKWEVDVFIPSLNFGIEYDGIYYHQGKESIDSEKSRSLANEGVRLLRIKEQPQNISKCYRENNVIYCNKRPSENQLTDIIKACFDYMKIEIIKDDFSTDINVSRDKYKIRELYIMGAKTEGLLAMYPELSNQWHPEKNLSIKPDMINPGSHKKYWWLCDKGHEWEAAVNSRVTGAGCPYCVGKLTCADNSLRTTNPELSKQWHPTKNGELTADDVTAGSEVKAWWLCEKGHEWEAVI